MKYIQILSLILLLSLTQVQTQEESDYPQVNSFKVLTYQTGFLENDLEGKIQDLIPQNYRIANWSDIKDLDKNGHSMGELWGQIGQQLVMLKVNGSFIWEKGTQYNDQEFHRFYFIDLSKRPGQSPHSGFLSHDHVKQMHLGSWSARNKILIIKEFNFQEEEEQEVQQPMISFKLLKKKINPREDFLEESISKDLEGYDIADWEVLNSLSDSSLQALKDTLKNKQAIVSVKKEFVFEESYNLYGDIFHRFFFVEFSEYDNQPPSKNFEVLSSKENLYLGSWSPRTHILLYKFE